MLFNDNTTGSLLAAVFMASMPTPKRGATARRVNLAVSSLCVGWVAGGFIDALIVHYVPSLRAMHGRSLAVSFTVGVFLPKTVALLYDKAPQAIAARVLGAISNHKAATPPVQRRTPAPEGEDKP